MNVIAPLEDGAHLGTSCTVIVLLKGINNKILLACIKKKIIALNLFKVISHDPE